MTLEKAVELIGHEKDRAQIEASGSDVSDNRRIYLWGLQDGYRRAIEIMGGKITENEQ